MQRVALVTGASRGIGLAIMERLATDGFFVVGCASTSGPIQQAAASLRDRGLPVEGEVLDVSDAQACTDIVDAVVQRHGTLDVLVHAAAIYVEAEFLTLEPNDWQRTIDVNLSGTFHIGQAAARAMTKRDYAQRGKARIVNISSTVSAQSEPNGAHYAASKAGVEALTRSMALELASAGIAVNCVAPGFIETAMTEEYGRTIDTATRNRLNPLGAFGKPENIAHVVAMLCDERTEFVTGATFVADGGQTAAFLAGT